jgi:hypothetical protein
MLYGMLQHVGPDHWVALISALLQLAERMQLVPAPFVLRMHHRMEFLL